MKGNSVGGALRKAEIEAIKRLSLVDFLAEIGYHPEKRTYKIFWYLSPLRQESNPSFAVYVNKEVQDWYDFGLSKGGSIIDFVMEYYGFDYTEAIRLLRKRIYYPEEPPFSLKQ